MSFFVHIEKALNKDEPLFTTQLTTTQPQLTTTQFLTLINSAAQRLVNDLQVRPGQRVLVSNPKSIGVLAIYFACLKIGAIFVPVNPHYKEMAFLRFFSNTSAALVLCEKENYEFFALRVCGSIRLLILSPETEDTRPRHFWSIKSEGPVPETYQGDVDVACLIHTSGTTSHPKAVKVTHSALLKNALALKQTWGIESTDTVLHCLPIFHIHGLFVAVNTAILAGAKIHWISESFNVDTVIEALPKTTIFMGVPTMFHRLMSSSKFPEAVKNMRLLISGSAPMAPTLKKQIHDRTGHWVIERYGMTETLIVLSQTPQNAHVVGCVGDKIDAEIKIVDEDTNEIIDRQGHKQGVLYVKSEGSCYWDTETSDDGWFRTGDIASYDQGQIKLHGRVDDLCKVGGYRVSPSEVEAALMLCVAEESLPVTDCCVFGVECEEMGTKLHAALVWAIDDPEARETAQAKLKEMYESTRPKHLWPQVYVYPENIPLNTMGKVSRSQLRQQYAG